MPRYLMTCSCGNTLPVETRQAGGQVVCRCGAALEVPALRRLRELPTEATEQVAAKRVWQPRYGGVAAFTIIAVALAATSLWLHVNEPTPPKFDTARMEKSLSDEMDTVTPSVAWQWWIRSERQLDKGFQVYSFHLAPEEEKKLAEKRLVKYTLLLLAGVSLVGAVCVAFWPAGAASSREAA